MMLPHYPVVATPWEKESGKPARHDAMISYMDGQVGRLLQAVSDLKIAEDTVVIFVGDNGTQASSPRQTDAGEVKGGEMDRNTCPVDCSGPGPDSGQPPGG